LSQFASVTVGLYDPKYRTAYNAACKSSLGVIRTGKIDSPIPLLNLTVDQKCKLWPQCLASSKQAGVLLLSSLQLCILTDSIMQH